MGWDVIRALRQQHSESLPDILPDWQVIGLCGVPEDIVPHPQEIRCRNIFHNSVIALLRAILSEWHVFMVLHILKPIR
jgi:hypothetical protein